GAGLHAEAEVADVHHPPADLAETDDAKALASQQVAVATGQVAPTPGGVATEVVAGKVTGDLEKRREDVLGHRIRVHAWRVPDRDAACLREVERDSIETGARPDDRLQAIEQLQLVSARGAAHDQAVCVPVLRKRRPAFGI